MGRGGNTNYLHCTEFAFWADAKNQFGGAAQEVPDRHGTEIIIESTANGVGDAFYDMFVQARDDWGKTEDLRNYLPIFLPWYIFPDYAFPAPSNFELDHEEKEILQRFNLTLDQMFWRRYAIKNKCQGDIDLFCQEYPATWKEAFRFSGKPIFSSKILTFQNKTDIEIKYGMFTADGFEEVDRKINCWAMVEPANSGHQYCLGIDTIEGKSSDPTNEKSELDYHGAAMLNRNTSQYVLAYKGRCEQWELGEQCLLAAKYYNEAYVAPEIPIGMVCLQVFKNAGYQYIYNRVIHEERLDEDISEELGWRTTTVTRKWLVDGFIAALRDNSVKVNFPWIVEEMETFIRDKTGKPIHMPGKHDDVLFGAMIAMQVHLKVPFNSGEYPYETTGDFDKPEPDYDLARIGAIDTGVEDL